MHSAQHGPPAGVLVAVRAMNETDRHGARAGARPGWSDGRPGRGMCPCEIAHVALRLLPSAAAFIDSFFGLNIVCDCTDPGL